VNRDGALIIGAALAALLLLWPRKATARPFDPGIDVRYGSGEPWPDELAELDILGVGLPIFEAETGEMIVDTADRNEQAFLYMLRRAEHTQANVASGLDYTTFYGGSRFTRLDDHPVLTGEKKGVRLSDDTCRKAGFGPGCVSTAAGGYQIIVPTWQRARELAPRLPDFTPASQDQAALRILDFIGARRYVRAGEFDEAVSIASGTWASLPGSTAGQNAKTYEQVLAYFHEGGGVA